MGAAGIDHTSTPSPAAISASARTMASWGRIDPKATTRNELGSGARQPHDAVGRRRPPTYGHSPCCYDHSCQRGPFPGQAAPGQAPLSIPRSRYPGAHHPEMAMIGNLRPASDADIARLLANPEEITRFLYGSDAHGTSCLVLNKAWHAIHFVLNGSRLGGDEPLNFLVDQGTPVGEVDVGYGPARVLNSQQVRKLADALRPIGPDQIAQRIDLERFDAEAI